MPGHPVGVEQPHTSRTLQGHTEDQTHARDQPVASVEPAELVILMPVFNDWIALAKLLTQLDAVLRETELRTDVVVVDDGSTNSPAEEDMGCRSFSGVRQVHVVHLRRNLGHQRAIAIGLAYVHDRIRCEAVVVMDSDGEDDPRDVPRLYRKYRETPGKPFVFAERAVRSESRLFRVFYSLYKVLHVCLTSRRIRVGNFSLVPGHRLSSLVAVAELWSHYAAAVYKSRQPIETIPTKRASRLHGEPKMNFIDLVIHGLSAMSVYSESIGVRLLAASSALVVLAFLALGAIVAVRLTTDLAIPGWATYAAGLAALLLFQSVMFSLVFSFIVISARDRMTFLPLRDYAYFVGSASTHATGLDLAGRINQSSQSSLRHELHQPALEA